MFEIPPFDIREYEDCCDFEVGVFRYGVDYDDFPTKRIPSPYLIILDKAALKYFVYFRKVRRYEVIQQIMDGYICAAYFIDPDWIISTQKKL